MKQSERNQNKMRNSEESYTIGINRFMISNMNIMYFSNESNLPTKLYNLMRQTPEEELTQAPESVPYISAVDGGIGRA